MTHYMTAYITWKCCGFFALPTLVQREDLGPMRFAPAQLTQPPKDFYHISQSISSDPKYQIISTQLSSYFTETAGVMTK